MIFEICAIVSVIIFAILAFFIIRTLSALQQDLKNINHLTQDLSGKMKLMESTFKSISTLGDMSEVKLNNLRDHQIKYNEFTHKDEYADDLVDFVVASVRLGTKLFRR